MIEPSRECAMFAPSSAPATADWAGARRIKFDLLVEAMHTRSSMPGSKSPRSMASSAAAPTKATRITSGSARRLGINARFSTSLDNGGASQILAVTLAAMAIEAGHVQHGDMRLWPEQLVAHPCQGSDARQQAELFRRSSCRANLRPNTAISARSQPMASAPAGTCRIRHDTRAFRPGRDRFREHALRNPEAR